MTLLLSTIYAAHCWQRSPVNGLPATIMTGIPFTCVKPTVGSMLEAILVPELQPDCFQSPVNRTSTPNSPHLVFCCPSCRPRTSIGQVLMGRGTLNHPFTDFLTTEWSVIFCHHFPGPKKKKKRKLATMGIYLLILTSVIFTEFCVLIMLTLCNVIICNCCHFIVQGL